MGRRTSLMRRRGRIITEVPLNPITMFRGDLVQWLRSDLGVTTVGGLVSNWADQSGNSHHAAQSSAGSRPTYVASGGPGNNPYVFSDTVSVTPWLDMTGTAGVGSTLAAGWTVIITQTAATIPGVAGTFFSTLAGTVPSDGSIIQWRRDSSNRCSAVMLSVTPANTFLTVATPDMNPANTWVTSMVTMSPARVRTYRVYGDGTSGSNTDTKATNTNIELGTGRLFRDGAVYYQSLAIQEVIMVKREITTGEIGQLQAYLRSRGMVF